MFRTVAGHLGQCGSRREGAAWHVVLLHDDRSRGKILELSCHERCVGRIDGLCREQHSVRPRSRVESLLAGPKLPVRSAVGLPQQGPKRFTVVFGCAEMSGGDFPTCSASARDGASARPAQLPGATRTSTSTAPTLPARGRLRLLLTEGVSARGIETRRSANARSRRTPGIVPRTAPTTWPAEAEPVSARQLLGPTQSLLRPSGCSRRMAWRRTPNRFRMGLWGKGVDTPRGGGYNTTSARGVCRLHVRAVAF